MKEFDVHFSLNGFFRRIEAKSQEEAMTIAEEWLTKAKPELERHARTGLGIEVTEAVNPE
jgi:ribosomal protein S7